MPIIKSAKKALRQSVRRKAVNDRRIKAMKEAIKKIERSVKEKKTDVAQKLIPIAYSAIDKASKRGVIKKNTASRRKAKIAKMIK